VLVVAPHPDDEAIGCGGAVLLHRRRGDPVRVVFLTSGEGGVPSLPPEEVIALREREAAEAAQILGARGLDFLRLPDGGLQENVERAAAALARVLAGHPVDLIYLPHPAESHPDHEAALPIVRAALGALAGAELPQLRGYEVWSPMTHPDWVEVISEVMDEKLRAVRCYGSQLALCRYDEAVRGLNCYRGIMNGGGCFAEAYQYLDPRPDQAP
jgi:LmbE family N-acetylglucosaminyl deacetylase